MKKSSFLRANSESGMAMLMALMTMVVLAILAGEMIYQSGVYSNVVFRQRDQLRATLLARSGLRLALLQLKVTKKAKAKVKQMGLGDNVSAVDKIWQTPLILPPPPIPGLSGIDTATMGNFTKSLGFEGSIATTIVGENGRVSLSSLIWPTGSSKVKGVEGGDQVDPNNPAGATVNSNTPQTADQKKEQLEKSRKGFAELFEEIIEKKRRNDDEFRKAYPMLKGEWLVANLLAWMDPETKVDGDNRDKNDYYSSVATPYVAKEAPLVSESEFHMIKGFDETITKLITDNFTVQISNSLDVNKASLLLIHAFIPELSDDAIERIGKRRNDESQGGAFKDANDFWAFVNGINNYEEAKKRLTERGIKILEPETAYRVVVVAQSGMSTKTWLANVGPLPPKIPDPKDTQGQTSNLPFQPPNPNLNPNSTGTSTSTSTNTETGDADSLNIVYLKAE